MSRRWRETYPNTHRPKCRACKGAEFIGNKHKPSFLLVQRPSYTNVLVLTDSVTYFQFQFPLLVYFYTAVEVKWLPIIFHSDDDENLINDKMAKSHRWKNYFEQLPNHPPVPCPDFPCNAQEDHHGCLEPSESEVHSAVRKLKNGKASGLCGITAEMLKASGNPGIQWLTGVTKQVWQSRLIPPDWKKGIIFHIYNGKGSPKDCRNYRGVTLLSVADKVIATVLLNKVRDQLLAHCRKEQSRFTPGRSTIDRLSHWTQSSKARRSFRGLSIFGILSSISRLLSTQLIVKALWKLSRSLGLQSKVVGLMEALYTDACSCVCADGVLSDWFTV